MKSVLREISTVWVPLEVGLFILRTNKLLAWTSSRAAITKPWKLCKLERGETHPSQALLCILPAMVRWYSSAVWCVGDACFNVALRTYTTAQVTWRRDRDVWRVRSLVTLVAVMKWGNRKRRARQKQARAHGHKTSSWAREKVGLGRVTWQRVAPQCCTCSAPSLVFLWENSSHSVLSANSYIDQIKQGYLKTWGTIALAVQRLLHVHLV